MAVAPIDLERDGVMEYFVSGVLGATRLLARSVGRDVQDLGYAYNVEGETQDFVWQCLPSATRRGTSPCGVRPIHRTGSAVSSLFLAWLAPRHAASVRH